MNEALATLKRLLPPVGHEYGYQFDEEKKEEKERQYKLEILERTVIFVQELLDRVQVLESQLDGHRSVKDLTLPPIRSWLPPSPPSSVRFRPVHEPIRPPPSLTSTSIASSTAATVTTEDASAASSLLQFGTPSRMARPVRACSPDSVPRLRTRNN